MNGTTLLLSNRPSFFYLSNKLLPLSALKQYLIPSYTIHLRKRHISLYSLSYFTPDLVGALSGICRFLFDLCYGCFFIGVTLTPSSKPSNFYHSSLQFQQRFLHNSIRLVSYQRENSIIFHTFLYDFKGTFKFFGVFFLF